MTVVGYGRVWQIDRKEKLYKFLFDPVCSCLIRVTFVYFCFHLNHYSGVVNYCCMEPCDYLAGLVMDWAMGWACPGQD